jgi:pimeloyl-[acyl-carrier protein] methyl ester esterase
MALFTQTAGEGPDLVLLHGWGLNADVWGRFGELLEKRFRVTRVDLPGHGRSEWNGRGMLDDWARQVLEVAPAQAAWAGWSLGSLVAQRAALLAQERVAALAVIAGTPSFVRRPDWQPAMLPSLLDGFAEELSVDFEKTLQRFLALQVRGSEEASKTLKQLRAGLLAAGKPDPGALQAGLDLLRDTDLRQELGSIGCPVRLVMGERDTLVPQAAAEQSLALYGNAGMDVIDGAGHAPFISHPQIVAETLGRFFTNNTNGAGESGEAGQTQHG